jgi:hypothetical protein
LLQRRTPWPRWPGRRAGARLRAPSYDTSLRWVAGDDPAAAADAVRRLEAQMSAMRFQQQYPWTFRAGDCAEL